ncbi:MAG: DUF554 domain-containing protein [Candidatus Methanofastidiosia archaeon]
MQGTLVNVAAVIIGSVIGVVIHSKLPKRIIDITFQGIGLFTLVLGISMAVKTSNFLLMIVSIVTGSVIGELLDIEKAVNIFSEKIKSKAKLKDDTFSEGFITASLLYCTGSMAILGAIEDGLKGEPHLLLAKSVLDGVTSIILASSLGVGVLFSAVPLLVYQGGITICAGLLQPVFTEGIITELTAVGGLLLVGLGITLLEIKQVKIMNMLPSLVVVIILAYVL